MEVGQIIKSKCGHDKDNYYLVLKVEGEFIYLVDGDNRSLDNPKKKKVKHVQKTNYVDSDIQNKVSNALKITNADIRNSIDSYKNSNQGGDDLGK